MCDSQCVVDLQLLKDCMYAFNEIPNRRLGNGLKTYDLALRINDAIVHSKTTIALSWSIEDVLGCRDDLTTDQALEVLIFAESKHDATIGVNWEVLEIHAEHLFPSSD